MSKVTSRLQVTIPKAMAEWYGIEPGDEIEFEAAGDLIRIIPPAGRPGAWLGVEDRLRLFDEATMRQRQRERHLQLPKKPRTERDWQREGLYDRGEPR